MDQLTSTQLSEWEAYDKIDPIGTWREDFRMAYICSVISNLAISIHGKRGAKGRTAIDFMPEWDKVETEPVKQSVEEMKAVLLEVFKPKKRVPTTILPSTRNKPNSQML